MKQQRKQLESAVVNAEQMARIEGRVFAAQMPVAALMEKAAYLSATRIQQLYSQDRFPSVGIIVGPGHNGGDALVIARELHLAGYRVSIYFPTEKVKELTDRHARYAKSLGIPFFQEIDPLEKCDFIIDGLFGLGQTRSLAGKLAAAIDKLNLWHKPTVSIDLPSGINTDTGVVLGTAVKATHTLCLGLWKLAFFQDAALEYIGKAERIDIGIPPTDVWSIASQPPSVRKITPDLVKKYLPLPRPKLTHKYQQGHLLIVCGSRRYAGGTILTGLGARYSGVGMLSIAVPESLKPLLVTHLPEALIIECPENRSGAIAGLPPLAGDFSKYDVVAIGPGLTTEVRSVVEKVLQAECPIVLDADALNILAELGTRDLLSPRAYPTVLTPHLGEFKRLFPNLENYIGDRIGSAKLAAKESGAIVLLKGARTAIADPEGSVWLLGESTPALARGGSGDVLTGLIGGLIAQNLNNNIPTANTVAAAAWWHASAGILAAKERTELGVDAFTLCDRLIPALKNILSE
ncbi:MAG: NAD(P)H-hydrate dehydratase [Prochloraceae cyanobacterium]